MTCNETVHVPVLWPVSAHRIPIRMLWCPRPFTIRKNICFRDVANVNVQIVRYTWVLVSKDKSNHLVADSLRSALRRAGVEQLYQVERMIGGIGNMFVTVMCSECQSDALSNKRG